MFVQCTRKNHSVNPSDQYFTKRDLSIVKSDHLYTYTPVIHIFSKKDSRPQREPMLYWVSLNEFFISGS